MKIQRLVLLIASLALTAAPALHAQDGDEPDHPFAGLFRLMRSPIAFARALDARPNVTATVSNPSANTVAVQAVFTTPSNQTVSVSSTTTRTDNGFTATAAVTPPNGNPVTINLSVTRAADVATIVTAITRDGLTKTNTRTVPVRRGSIPPPRG